ncbi:DUF2250 domain-containing protein [Thermosulfuriphilus ammonigenes]|uniref:DUF2250 domain-containing protein n=1 Tax=Thermosulfuriphilus ammonigenes TaxID=1936021 RepID=A0A6G7PYB1_9BACT|nr:DUF2250 domain-containing protein [Thermosulfuriphilus ammonigenes]MBA2848989.1 putative transcriptional regulator [Thermosulfuriphilus ammonigenes]QIJ72679.1 DUF2250 domain-containing protein [Thermosulfuriphilus ammonigenes]
MGFEEKLKGLNDQERAIIFDLRQNGPDCAKFISRRLGLELGLTMEILRDLERKAILERVSGTFLKKKGLRRPKHMNHTYYRLTRPMRIFFRRTSLK